MTERTRKSTVSGKRMESTSCNQLIDWYSPGQSRTLEVNGVQVTVRLVGRKGRRARIAIAACGVCVTTSR